MSWSLALHVAATLMMTGLIWLIQCVHYPLFAQVGSDTFQAYHARHTQWITPIVGPLMLMELATGFMLLQDPPPGVSTLETWIGFGLIILIWASTALLQIPLHNTLAQGFNLEVIERLVAGNWIRTIAWSLRTGLVLWWITSAAATLR